MASKSYHCKDCNLFFDSPQSLNVHLQYHKENLMSMWMGTEEIKKENDLESDCNLGQTNYTSSDPVTAPSSEYNANMFSIKQEIPEMEAHPSFVGASPLSPMEYDFKGDSVTSPQECHVSQGPSSASSMLSYSQPSPSAYYQDFSQQQHVTQVLYNNFHPSFINANYDEQYYNRQSTTPSRFHPYGRSPLPTPSPGTSLTDIKEERLTPHTPEILDLDSQKVLNSNVSQDHLEPLPSMWRPHEHFPSPNNSINSISLSSGLTTTTGLGSSPTGIGISPTGIGISPTGIGISPTGMGPSPSGIRSPAGMGLSPIPCSGISPSQSGMPPLNVMEQAPTGMGPSPTGLRPSSTGGRLNSPALGPSISDLGPHFSGMGQSSSAFSHSRLVAPSPGSSSTLGPMPSVIGISHGINSTPLEMGVQPMLPPLQQSIYGSQHSYASNNQTLSLSNTSGFSSANLIPPYYSQGLSINSGVTNNSPAQLVSRTQSPSPRESSEYPSNVKRPKSFKCIDCNKFFTSQGHLKRHYNTTLHKNMSKLNGESSDSNNTQSSTPDVPQPPVLSPSSKSGETTATHDDESNLSTSDSVDISVNTFQPSGSAFQPPPVTNTNYLSQSGYINSQSTVPHASVVQPYFGQSPSFPPEQPLTAPTLYHGQFSTNPTYMSQPPVSGSGSNFLLGSNYIYQSQQGGLHGPGFHSMNEYPGPNSVDGFNSFRLDNDRVPHQFTSGNELAQTRISPEPSGDTGSEASMDSSESSSTSPPDNYKCNDCNKTFNRMCYLTQHRSTYHEGEKPFKCGICGKRFTDEITFTDHQGKHAGEKPYKCEVCPKQFNHKTDLRRHMCLHTGEKPFSCEQCGKGFIRKDHMLKHFQTHRKKALAANGNNSQSHSSMSQNSSFASHRGLHPPTHPSHGPGGHPHAVAPPVY